MSDNFYYYWMFNEGLPERICDEIIQYGKDNKDRETTGIIGELGQGRDIKKNPLSKKETKKLHELRKSNVVWMDDPWIYKEIHPFIERANIEAEWNYQYDWSETCQFTKYEKGDYYDWHCDSWRAPYKQGNFQKGKIRKLSVTVCLSDSNSFKGGDLQFDYRDQHPRGPKPIHTVTNVSKGSIIVFPSWLWHRVTPVTKGIRHSLVIWSCGWPFK